MDEDATGGRDRGRPALHSSLAKNHGPSNDFIPWENLLEEEGTSHVTFSTKDVILISRASDALELVLTSHLDKDSMLLDESLWKQYASIMLSIIFTPSFL